jgi:hypothetical protein
LIFWNNKKKKTKRKNKKKFVNQKMNTKKFVVGIFSGVALLSVMLTVFVGFSQNVEKVQTANIKANECIGCVVGRESIPLTRGAPASLSFDVPNLHENSKVKLRVFVDDVRKRGTPVQVKLVNEENEQMVLSLKPEKESLLEAEITPFVRSFTRNGKLTVHLVGENVNVASPKHSIEARQPSVIVEKTTLFQAPKEVKGYFIVMSGVVIGDLGGASRPAQIAKALVEEGYDVTYLYSDNTEYRNKVDSNDGRSINIDLASQYPDTLHLTDQSKFSVEEYLNSIDSSKMLVTVMEIPYYSFLLNAIKLKAAGSVLVYDVIDDWSGDWGVDMGYGEVEEKAILLSDIVSAVVPSLVEKYEKNYNRAVLYLPNAVDVKLFDISQQYERPIDMPEGKVALYYGTLWGSWFDWNLVAYLAGNLQDWTFVFIGEKVENEYWNPSVDSYPNVKFLGMKPQTSLPAYAAAATTLIMPWKVDTISLGASPLKIYEWIAMQKPIIVPGLTQLDGMPGVTLSSSYKQFSNNLKMSAETEIDTSACVAFISENDWASRAQLLASSSEKPEVFASSVEYVPETDNFWFGGYTASIFYSNNTIDCGLAPNGTDVIANGTVSEKFTAKAKDIYKVSDKVSKITFYFSAMNSSVNISHQSVEYDAKALKIEKTGNFMDGTNVTTPMNLDLILDISCLIENGKSQTVTIKFQEGTYNTEKEITFEKECKSKLSSSSSGGGLGTGAWIGIGIASTVALVALIGGGVFWWRKRSAAGYEAVPHYD